MNTIGCPRKIMIVVAACFIGLVTVRVEASPGTIWLDPAGGAFNDPGNWDSGVVPGADDDAEFAAPGAPAYTVVFNRNENSNSATVRGDDDVTFDLNGYQYHVVGPLDVGCYCGGWQDGHLTVTDGLLLTNNLYVGEWDYEGTSSLTVAAAGQITVQDNASFHGGLSIDGAGSLLSVGDWLDTYDAPTTVSDGGQITVVNHASFDGGVSIEGAGSLLSVGSLYADGPTTVSNGGQITVVNGADLHGAVFIDGVGSLLSVGWLDAYDGAATVSNGGQITVVNGASFGGGLCIDGAESSLSVGEHLGADAPTTVSNDGQISANDAWFGAGATVSNGGQITVEHNASFHGGVFIDGVGSLLSAGWLDAHGPTTVSNGGEITGVNHASFDGGTTVSSGGQISANEAWFGEGLSIDGARSLLSVGWLEAHGPTTVSNGGQISANDAWFGEGLSIDGAGSSLTCSDYLELEESGSSMQITNGAHVFSQYCDIEGEGTSATLTGAGSTWQANYLWLVEGEISVGSGTVLDVADYLEVCDGGTLALAAGSSTHVGTLLIAFGEMTMDDAAVDIGRLCLFSGTVAGSGAISAPVSGDSSSAITASGGDLTLGDAARFDGFLMDGTIAMGSHTVTLNTQSFATVGLLTTINGGMLQADNGVFIQGGGTIVGYGSVAAPIAAAIGSTISASGDLVLGDATRYDGFFSDGLLHVNSHTVTVQDRNEAVLGSLTTISGGTLAAPNGFLVLEGRNLTGRGFVTGNFKNQGSVIGDGTAAGERVIFDSPWVVSGKGTFVDTLILGTFAPGESLAVVMGTNQGFGGIVQIELGGTQPGFGDDKHDQIVDTGTILLLGSPTLEVLPWNDFVPSIGDEFTIMTWQDGLDGMFGAVQIDRWFKSYGISFGLNYNSIVGAGNLALEAVSLGDFDWDGDVDADDIDALRANQGNPAFDLDGDGDADSDDMDMLINTLVETTAGVGSEYGDFNLDGTIDTTDLTILATNFGVGSTWAEGNANCDTFIDTTDLTILATNFGFVASASVPEPATLGLLALGGLGLLRRKGLRSL